MQQVPGQTLAIKDEDRAHPVATAWRPTLRGIAQACAQEDYTLQRGVDCVSAVPADTASQIGEYIADYGEALADLPEDTWTTSVAQWMGGYWDVLVDLWTVESGASDMVLGARVFETDDGYRVEVGLVYVP